MQLEEIEQLKLISMDNKFFSPTFYENKEFIKFLFQKYSMGTSGWKRYIDPGWIVCDDKSIHKYLRGKHVKTDDVLGIYQEKKRKRSIMILKGYCAYINQSKRICLNAIDRGILQNHCKLFVDGVKIDICLSDSVRHLLLDYIDLQNMDILDDGLLHPCRNLPFDSKDAYIKIMTLYCAILQGMTASQMKYLAQVANALKCDSNSWIHLSQLISLCKIKDLQKLIAQYLSILDDRVRNYILKDMLFLLLTSGLEPKREGYIVRLVARWHTRTIDNVNAIKKQIEKEILD